MTTPTHLLATCALMAAHMYHVPPAILLGIGQVEGGRVGQVAGPNSDGSYDLGPMQINSTWIPSLARIWHTNRATAWRWVRDDACTNMYVAAWILKRNMIETGSLSGGIARYHSASTALGRRYANKTFVAAKIIESKL